MKTISVALTICSVFMAAACGDGQGSPTTVQAPLGLKTGLASKAGYPAKVSADVREKAGALRFAAIIIRLNMDVDLAPLNSRERATAIRRVSDRVIAQVSPFHVRIVHRYDIVPILAARANGKGLAALAEIPEVKEVVLDRLEQPSLDNSTRLINAHLTWPQSTGSGRFVAILDTGTDALHPFVGQRVLREACFRGDKKCRNLDFQEIGPGAARNMARGHGMHVAGIAAGGKAPLGGVPRRGVASGAGIIAINVSTPSGSWVTDQVKALEHVAQLRESGVKVVAANISLNGELSYQAACDHKEMERKIIIDHLFALGVATVVAAGNKPLANAVAPPGCITSAVTVSSVTYQDRINTANSRSSLTDFMAPGDAILSSLPNGYGKQSGTSMAAPHVSGAIALLSAAVPQATLPQILAALDYTGRPLNEGNPVRTYKRIDVQAALLHLQGK